MGREEVGEEEEVNVARGMVGVGGDEVDIEYPSLQNQTRAPPS